MIIETITVKYSCKGCGLHRVEVEAPCRPDPMDVVIWVQNVVGAYVQTDHKQRSPHCQSQEMSDLMIPIENRDYVGAPVKQ